MANKRKGRLELDWVDKGDIIITKFDDNGKSYPASYFHGQVSDEELMPRELELVKSVGDPDSENMLIQGENLIVMRSLEREFAGRIKLIYIDPPFNTGQDFEDYEDGLEHSIWLTMMKTRLEILNKLLSNDGAIVIHIDYREESRLKLLMDEIFTGGFRNSIVVKRGTKNVQQQFDTIDSLASGHDTLLLYTAYSDTRFPHCRSALVKVQEGTWNNHWRGTDRPTMRYKLFGIKPKTGQWRWSEERTMQAIRNYEEYIKKDSDTMSIDEYYSMCLTEDGIKLDFVRLSKTGKPEHYVPPRSFRIVSDVWMDVRTSGKLTELVHEKHEDLLFRVINWLTSPGDWVLDSFLGSGTTAAVAHKLNRKWIGIELGEHAKKLCIPRLRRVVSGEDKTGISKQVGWKGGGGFKFYKLGEPLIIKHKDYPSIKIINPKYYNTSLIKVICKLEGFKFRKDDKIFHGVNKLGNKYAHITEQYVSQGYIDLLQSKLTDNEELIVYCFNYDDKIALPQNILIKKLPDDLGKPYQLRLRI
ncbi:MAG TPA: site-specific DNA-methyltransferase [Candidatus Wujingus californicus]|uniref:site-specific DNA-methyltransferase n=1 Tax=Candidatus Wujingus californicus TaxID=3367618 RepID=UPI001DC5C9A2|nr:site-specific DNA-methyltransferase [Planctomycetota bacterium]MDO8131903.1 site-specific DNA-methyltransferase [Candidatus Brocadiales bacterium]